MLRPSQTKNYEERFGRIEDVIKSKVNLKKGACNKVISDLQRRVWMVRKSPFNAPSLLEKHGLEEFRLESHDRLYLLFSPKVPKTKIHSFSSAHSNIHKIRLNYSCIPDLLLLIYITYKKAPIIIIKIKSFFPNLHFYMKVKIIKTIESISSS